MLSQRTVSLREHWPWALPGFILWGWTLLAHGSTAQFAVLVFARVSEVLNRYTWAAILIAAAWIVLVVMWPEWKQKRPFVFLTKIPLPRTLRGRIETVELGLKAWEKQHCEIAGIQQRLAANESQIVAIRTAVEAIPHVLDLQALIIEATQASEAFSDDSTRDCEGWARLLEPHVRHLKAFSARSGEGPLCGELLTAIERWRTGKGVVSSKRVSDLLDEHCRKLYELRRTMLQKPLQAR
jgi:hypothetical protein